MSWLNGVRAVLLLLCNLHRIKREWRRDGRRYWIREWSASLTSSLNWEAHAPTEAAQTSESTTSASEPQT